MLPINSEYYGDQSRWFLATVIDNVPPFGLEGKVKIHIKGIHSSNANDIPHKDLPWADVLISTHVSGASGKGITPRLTPGTVVYGTFLDGQASQSPLIMGQIHTTEYPNDNQERNVLVLDEEPDPEIRPAVALNYFVNLGYRPHIAATIVGTMDVISGLNPKYDVDNFFGIMGWEKTKNRLNNLKMFADGFDSKYPFDVYVSQLAFVAYELRTSKSNVIGMLLNTPSIASSPSIYRINSRLTVGNGSAASFVEHYTEKKLDINVQSVEQAAINYMDYFV